MPAPIRSKEVKNFGRQPVPIEHYAEGIESYVGLVAPRSRAIYQIGKVRSDGLSDLDLLVVPEGKRFDNSEYFSAKHRLPSFRRLFPHEPRILPWASLDVIRYTSHRRRTLVHGHDVLSEMDPCETPEQRWALLFEGYLKYHRFAKATASHEASIERWVTKATSLAFSLELLDGLQGTALARPYKTQVEQARACFFESEERMAQSLVEIKELYEHGYAALNAELGKALYLRSGEDAADFAFEFLHQGRALRELDEAAMKDRRVAIRRYHRELVEQRFHMGSLFSKAAYGEQIKKFGGRSPLAKLLHRYRGHSYLKRI